jgi:hypothetical protein
MALEDAWAWQRIEIHGAPVTQRKRSFVPRCHFADVLEAGIAIVHQHMQ